MIKPKLFFMTAIIFVSMLVVCFCTSVSLAQANWDEFKAMCARQGHDALPNPPRCVERTRTIYTPPPDNGEAERRAEEQRRKDEEERQRLAREKKEQEDAEQKKRDAERDAAYKELKGSTGRIGTIIGSNSDPNDPPLKGSRVDTGVKDGRPKTGVRDFSGPNSAWKQLFCAADIMNTAIAALNIRDERSVTTDPVRFKDLAREAGNALAGDPNGIACRAAPGLPKFSAKYDSPGKLMEASQRLLNKVVALADKLEKARETKAAATTAMNKTSAPDAVKPLADPVAEQRRLNAIRDEEAKRIWKAQQDFKRGDLAENDAKTQIGKIQEDVKKAIDDPEFFPVVFEDAPPPTVAPKSAAGPKSSTSRGKSRP